VLRRQVKQMWQSTLTRLSCPCLNDCPSRAASKAVAKSSESIQLNEAALFAGRQAVARAANTYLIAPQMKCQIDTSEPVPRH
jgi:hypothetical protein